MKRRRRVWKRRHGQGLVVRLVGEVDGSSACQALELLRASVDSAGTLVLDLSGVTEVQPFGLGVLARGLRTVARHHLIRITVPPDLLPVLSDVAASLLAERVV
jgi:anti-anti-sigma factor